MKTGKRRRVSHRQSGPPVRSPQSFQEWLQSWCLQRFRRLDLVDSRTPSNILLRNALSICLSILTVIVVGCDSLLLAQS